MIAEHRGDPTDPVEGLAPRADDCFHMTRQEMPAPIVEATLKQTGARSARVWLAS